MSQVDKEDPKEWRQVNVRIEISLWERLEAERKVGGSFQAAVNRRLTEGYKNDDNVAERLRAMEERIKDMDFNIQQLVRALGGKALS